MSLAFHPLANIFPLIAGAEFDALVEDIRQHGVRDPIILLDGQILDGRNRYRAMQRLVETGEVPRPGWANGADGAEGGALQPGALDPETQLWPFEPFDAEANGDPLAYVLSKNLARRHLNESQRAMVAAKLETLRHGGDRRGLQRDADEEEAAAEDVQDANWHLEKPVGVDRASAAEALHVSPRSIARAAKVIDHGVSELQQAVAQGEIAVSKAEKIARLPENEQPEALARALPAGARAIMGSRAEPPDSLDYFPTPPWATRALIERVFRALDVPPSAMQSAWEPACGEGHIAEVLREYFSIVHASDIHDYGYAAARGDFLKSDAATAPIVDWIITNPPFGNAALEFVLRAQSLAPNVAMFFRTQWAVEGIDRYERLFSKAPPTLVAFFSERVPLVKGRWDPEASTATAYCWLVWREGHPPQPPLWIQPGCRVSLSCPDDVARFTAHPVISIPLNNDGYVPCATPATSSAAPMTDSKAAAAMNATKPPAGATTPSPTEPPKTTSTITNSPPPGTAAEHGSAATVPPVNNQSPDDGLDIPPFLRRARQTEEAAP